jgi:uroporphyrinogen-III synthase
MVTLLVTRPEPDASETAARLNALALDAVVEPLLAAETLPTPLPDAAGFVALVLTSANALRTLAARGEIARLRHLPVLTVGDHTADIATALGFADVHSADGAFADLVHLIVAFKPAGPLLYPAAERQSGDLAAALAPHGISIATIPVYAMHKSAALSDAVRKKLADGQIGAALLYSRRTAEAFVALAPPVDRARFGVLCLSAAVAEPLAAAHFERIAIAAHPSEAAMLDLAAAFSDPKDTRHG